MSSTRSLRIAHVLWTGEVGGIERLVYDLSIAQREDGLDVKIIFGRADGLFANRARAGGVPVVDLGLTSGYDIRPHKTKRMVDALCDTDVAHLHGFNFVFASGCIRARVPILFTEHGNFDRDAAWFRKNVRTAAKSLFLRRAVAVITATGSYTSRRMKMYGVAPSEIPIVRNGTRISHDDADPAATHGASALRVAYVGRLVSSKRVDRLIRSVAATADRAKPEVVVIGDGPTRNDLEAFAARLHVDAHIHFLGERRDAKKLLEGMDAVVLPSEGEPFGLVLLEGAARGVLPVVFRDGGGALEVLPPDGEIVDDEAQLARLFEKLRESPLIGPESRRERAHWTRERFAIERVAQEYRALYEQMTTDAGVPH